MKNDCGMREYSPCEELVNNLPYMAMIVLGAVILVAGLGHDLLAWIAGGAYFVYGLIGALWIIIFMCPYCGLQGTRRCPCGYGRISAQLRDKEDADGFREKFKKHIPVIAPLWFIPLCAGGAVAVRRFSWWLLVLLVIFVVDAFLVLPQVSTKHGCVDCAQKDTCPWMGRKK